MTVFELALLIGCLIAALVNRLNPRVLMWIGAGMADYVASSIYYAGGWPFHPFATAMADASVCLCIYFWGRYKWEMVLYRAFQLSVLVSLMRMTGWIDDPYVYALALELCCWLALVILTGTGVAKAWGDGNAVDWLPRRRVYRALHFVGEKRSSPPFTSTPE